MSKETFGLLGCSVAAAAILGFGLYGAGAGAESGAREGYIDGRQDAVAFAVKRKDALCNAYQAAADIPADEMAVMRNQCFDALEFEGDLREESFRVVSRIRRDQEMGVVNVPIQ